MPRNRGNITFVLASMDASGMGATLAVEGATDREVFSRLYVEEVLAPILRSGQIVVMDNLTAHKRSRPRTHRGARLRAAVPAALLP